MACMYLRRFSTIRLGFDSPKFKFFVGIKGLKALIRNIFPEITKGKHGDASVMELVIMLTHLLVYSIL